MSAKTSLRIKPHAKPKVSLFGHLLDPIDQLAEAIFSILILLTFTLSFRIFVMDGPLQGQTSAQYNINDLFVAAFGAIVAWGIIDGIMYILVSLLARGDSYRLLRHIQAAETRTGSIEVIADEFDYVLEPISDAETRRTLYESILSHLEDSRPRQIGLKFGDFTGAAGTLLVAVLAAAPSLAPLALLQDHPYLAIRLSIGISFVMLFICGYLWGKYTGLSRWKTGFLLFSVGIVMGFVAVFLGG